VVTGHPNHELAILGFVQRFRPRLLFLTDGGGGARVEESRQSLAALGLLGRARFLDWREGTLYRALLEHDTVMFAQLVDQVRAEIEVCRPQQVLCEAIELYNPLHDITLPIVRAATRGLDGIEIVEFPLIAQEPASREHYRVQRPAEMRTSTALRLTPTELAAKERARAEDYPSLSSQLGTVLTGLDREHAAVEYFATAADERPSPGRHHVLRYEWRGRLLEERGEVDRVITFRDHFLPMVAALEQGAVAVPGHRT
jgi:hypothetical protein